MQSAGFSMTGNALALVFCLLAKTWAAFHVEVRIWFTFGNQFFNFIYTRLSAKLVGSCLVTNLNMNKLLVTITIDTIIYTSMLIPESDSSGHFLSARTDKYFYMS